MKQNDYNMLYAHAMRYPLMQPEDLFKLLYQSELGGGHFIENTANSLARLTQEVEALQGGVLSVESIGQKYSRLHLAAIDSFQLQLVHNLFFQSAKNIENDKTQLKEKLLSLLDFKDQHADLFSFSQKQLQQSLTCYLASHCKAISHSDIYRINYHPHYRVIQNKYADFFALFLAIAQLQKEKNAPLLIAIDGPCASGKSTLAALLSTIFDCNIFPMDDFFLPFSMRDKQRLGTAGGNVHYERFLQEVLLQLPKNTSFSYQRFNCQSGEFELPTHIAPKQVNIIEGSYSHHPTLEKHYDLKVFLTVDATLQKSRILQREHADSATLFFNRWIPLEHHYFDSLQIQQKSDLVF